MAKQDQVLLLIFSIKLSSEILYSLETCCLLLFREKLSVEKNTIKLIAIALTSPINKMNSTLQKKVLNN
jgi:hypothetical protein